MEKKKLESLENFTRQLKWVEGALDHTMPAFRYLIISTGEQSKDSMRIDHADLLSKTRDFIREYLRLHKAGLEKEFYEEFKSPR